MNSLKQHFFWKYAFGKYALFTESTDKQYVAIQTIIKFTYLFFIFLVFGHFFNMHTLANSEMIAPLWPMLPFKGVSTTAISLFLNASMLLSFILLVFKKDSRFLRIFAFVMYFFYVAFINSFGKINHTLHLPLMLLFCFIFLPKMSEDNYKKKTILVFASAQFFLLLSYSLTGFWKLFWGVIEFFTNDVSLFSPLSFRNMLVMQFEIKETTFLGEWFLEHYTIGWLLYLVVVYIEAFSIFIFFKANLHKVWGVLLLLVHAGVAFVMDVNFYASTLAIGLLLLASPFNKETSVLETLKSLPIISEILKLKNNK